MPRLFVPVTLLVEKMARSMAVLGGLVLSALIILTCVSIIGRGMNSLAHADFVQTHLQWLSALIIQSNIRAITGDFELVEAGIAFAVFCFLPACQFYHTHATVDVFVSLLPPLVVRLLIMGWESIFAVIMVLITWKLYDGMMSKLSANQVSYLLEFPTWWTYALSLLGACIATCTAIYCATAKALECLNGENH